MSGPLWLSQDDARALVTESEWQGVLRGLLTSLGWRVYHTKFSIKSDPGYPDLTAVHPAQRRIVLYEVKTESGKLTDHQRTWLRALVEAGVEVAVLRPSDWDLAVQLAQRRIGDGEETPEGAQLRRMREALLSWEQPVPALLPRLPAARVVARAPRVHGPRPKKAPRGS